MSDNNIILNEKEAKLLKDIMNDWVKLMKGSNHMWEQNKFTYSTLIDKVYEAVEFHKKSIQETKERREK